MHDRNVFLSIVKSSTNVDIDIVENVLGIVNRVFSGWFNGFYRGELYFGSICRGYGFRDVGFVYYSLFSSFVERVVVYVFDPSDLIFYVFNGVSGKTVVLGDVLSGDSFVGFILACGMGYPRSMGIVNGDFEALSRVLESHGLESSISSNDMCWLERLKASRSSGVYTLYVLYGCRGVEDRLSFMRKIILSGVFSNRVLGEGCILKPIWINGGKT